MARKRKRGLEDREVVRKRTKCNADPLNSYLVIQHSTLSAYYPKVLTLREYFLSRLPISSKSRRRKISAIKSTPIKRLNSEQSAQAATRRHDQISKLAEVLDSTLVGLPLAQPGDVAPCRIQDFASFSQQVKLTAESSIVEALTSQTKIVNFVIWLLFHKEYRNIHRPLHMLCHGFQRATASNHANLEHYTVANVPGIISHYPNSHVETLKGSIWNGVLSLLGKDGEQIMMDLLIECGLFLTVSSGKGNLYQLSGTPLTELQALHGLQPVPRPRGDIQVNSQCQKSTPAKDLHSPSAITFVRSRMLYARAALNAKGKVRFGFRHIHVLNRFPQPQQLKHTAHIMKYMFPRQFGLHNVFTSNVDPRETVQSFKDYTLREQEITQVERQARGRRGHITVLAGSFKRKFPKRLRGEVIELVREMQKLHSRCAYKDLLKHYCPVDHLDGLRQQPASRTLKSAISATLKGESISASTTTESSLVALRKASSQPIHSFTDAATPPAHVSAFCRSSLSNLIPHAFWGKGIDGEQNERMVMQQVDRFIHMRRFENLTLHVVFQGLRVTSVSWLIPPNVASGAKISSTDMHKRTELFLEFLYYVFDSLLIPLVRSNFHVTESSIHRNRLLYFRHDVWRQLTEPALMSLKLSIFEEIPSIKAKHILDARTLGFSQIRLLPKTKGVRPIMNLRRRAMKLQNGKVSLGRSINSIMAPVFNIFDYEKTREPDRLGSSLFSIGDIYRRLKAFKTTLSHMDLKSMPLYFIKIDVQSCFDTIPQRRVMKLMEQITSEDEYRIARHTEIKPSRAQDYQPITGVPQKPIRKFIARARGPTDFTNFSQIVRTDLAANKTNTIFVDNIVQSVQEKDPILDLLQEHIERNVVKIGKKFFRQKAGIPQGSVLSSLLCNFFYAELETEVLGFLLNKDGSILLRLIDDFLLITTNKQAAKSFLQIMHDGVEAYGVRVNPDKSLVNFEVAINGVRVARLAEGSSFPYCGTLIDTTTLEITKDRSRRTDAVLADSLTVEPSKVPGRTFHRKILNAMKIQMDTMFLDTAFNSTDTVLATIYQNFMETAMKCYRYAKSLQKEKQPNASILTTTIQDLITLTSTLIHSKRRNTAENGFRCAITKPQIEWLALTAFHTILSQKQSAYHAVLSWIATAMQAIKPPPINTKQLARAVDKGRKAYAGYKF